MKVRCVQVPSPTESLVLDSSPWITVEREYAVLGILAVFGRPVELRLLTDDGWSLGLFRADCFLTVDSAIPPNWDALVREGGILELAPRAWLANGFWESYYDGDPAARELVDRELAIILGQELA